MIKIHKMLPINLSRVIKGKTENEDSVIEKLLPQYLDIILKAMAATCIGNSMQYKFNIIMCFLLGLWQETDRKVAFSYEYDIEDYLLLGYDTIWSHTNLIKMFINIYQTTQHSDPKR